MSRVGLVVGVSAIPACGDTGLPAGVVEKVDTVGGVEVVTTRIIGPEPAVAWSVDTLNAVEIGTLEGPEETQFGVVSGLAVLADGRILVADGQAAVLRVFDPGGNYLETWGRRGEGPGEFQSIDGVVFDARRSRTIVRDPRMNRVTILDAAGRYLESFRLVRPYSQFSSSGSFWIDSAGRIHDRTQLSAGMEIDSIGVVTYDASGQVLNRTLVAATAPRRILLKSADGAPKAAALVPFGTMAKAAVYPAGEIIGGTGQAYQLEVHRQGAVVRRILKEEPPAPLPAWAADTTAARATRLRESDPAGSLEIGELPEFQPFFASLLVDQEGFLWVGRSGEAGVPSSRYDIFDRGGRFVGVLDIPPMFLDEVGSDYIAGRALDDLGVGRVRVVRLTRN